MFHTPRYRAPRPGLLQRLWEWHDAHPLPPGLNRAARYALHWQRLARHALTYGRTRPGDPSPTPRDHFLTPRPFEVLPLSEALDWFERVHQANEAVYEGDGVWRPQPFALYAGRGVSIEEAALRIPGYLAAHRATGRTDYLLRAREAGEHLLRDRLHADGHLLLQGHIAIDFTYAIAGRALLSLWEQDRARDDLFTAARLIGDRLVEAHIAGSVNHATIPVQLLAPLYRYTGEKRYLRAAHTRLFRAMIPFQLKQGDWVGHEGRLWYLGVNLLSLIAAYRWTPFALEYARRKDVMAEAIRATTNRLISAQDSTGAFPLVGYDTPETEWDGDLEMARQVVAFSDAGFTPRPIDRGEGMIARRYLGHGAFELDALISLYEALDVREALPVAHGYAALLASSERLWRLEFNTYGAGRYLGLVDYLVRAPAAAKVSASQHSLSASTA